MRKPHWLHQPGSKINASLRQKIMKCQRKQVMSSRIRVIIQLKHKWTASRLHSLRKRLGANSLPIQHRLRFLNAFSSKVSTHCLKRLCSCSDVHKVYLDGIKKNTLHIATPSIGSKAVRRFANLSGKGINVAIIDTGVYPHRDLTNPVNRIVAFKDLVDHKKQPYDDNGHGTHLAGDVAGNGRMSRGKYSGPGPEAGIVAIKALNRVGVGLDSTIIKGIEWCVVNRKRLRIRILTMSFGGPIYGRCSEDPLCQAVEKAVRAGIVVIVAAGNSGPTRGTIESPGNSPSAITVGAVNDHRKLSQADDKVAPFSSRGPASGRRLKPDLVAPGYAIVSLRAPRSTIDRSEPYNRVGNYYFVMSGTSVAAPVVAGAAAQLLQRNPALTPAQVKTLLKRHAYRLRASVYAQGSGVVNARFLLKAKPNNPKRVRRIKKLSGSMT